MTGCERCGAKLNKGKQFCSYSCAAKTKAEARAAKLDCKRVGSESFNKAIGRWTIWVGGKNVYRYRWIMEQHLGRELRTDEHVHHKNGNTTDDRIENLELISIREHGRLHSAEGQAALRKLMKFDWSFEHERCVHCGTTDREHVGHGECSRCYFRNRARRLRAVARNSVTPTGVATPQQQLEAA